MSAEPPPAEDLAAAAELRYQVSVIVSRTEMHIRVRDSQWPAAWPAELVERRKAELDARISENEQTVRRLINRAGRLERGTASTHAGGVR